MWEWQRTLARELSRLSVEKGVRLLIHAFPQSGKSWLVSTRLPAWLIGMSPTTTIGLACFNEGRAKEFGKLTAELLVSDEFKQMFPDRGSQIPDITQAGMFTTYARGALRDTQVSFVALGMQTGYTSRGNMTLICDDVYRSAEDAYSTLINDQRWLWWERTVSPRIDFSTNVIMMFHRYHDGDLMGKLIDRDGLIKDGGMWKMLRFPAFADKNEDGSDPTGRKFGELLSPKYGMTEQMTIEWLEDIREKDPMTFMSQFQGDPSDVKGMYFKYKDFEIIDMEPPCRAYARGWDVAFSLRAGDYTVGVKIGLTPEGEIIVLDMWRDRVTGYDAQKTIVRNSMDDGPEVVVGVEDSSNTKHLISILEQPEIMFQMPLQTVQVWGASKWARAQTYAGMVGRGKVKLLKAPWNHPFIREHTRFRNKKTDIDDIIDAMVVAIEVLGTSLGSIESQYQPPSMPGSFEFFERVVKDQHGNAREKDWYE